MARKDEKLEHLSKVRLFAALPKKDLNLIGRASDEVRVPAGKVLVEQGKPGFEFYLILAGKASVSRGGKKVATVGPGQYFGELAVLDRRPRNSTVKAETDMELLVLGQREFSGLLDEVPGLAHKLLQTMAGRLWEADTKAVHH
jgi:CRP-like cAMP-binding protein